MVPLAGSRISVGDRKPGLIDDFVLKRVGASGCDLTVGWA